MGLLKGLFGKKQDPTPPEPRSMDLAFVLLPEPRLPDSAAIIAAYADLSASGALLRGAPGDADDGSVVTFRTGSDSTAFVGLIPAPVPGGEADAAARFSLSSLGKGWNLPDHGAHLVVTAGLDPSLSRLDQLSRFTSLLAAVAQATGAVGIYWGDAGATHDPEFFISLAAENHTLPNLMLWSGVSIARERDGRASLLSLGMSQLDLPDLLLLAPGSGLNAALATMFDLLAYLVSLGEPLPEGDTVGRTAEERLPVRYIPSPLDPSKTVWSVELP
jgi:hypothetical protein